MTDNNPSMDNSNGEEYKEKGRRGQDEVVDNGGKSNAVHAGTVLVLPPPTSQSNNNSNRRSRIARPEPFDVLCGRGKPIQNHPGNVILHRIVDEQCVRYHGAPRLRKRGIADELVQAIKNSKRFEQQLPGRFIRHAQDNRGEYWEEISEDAARDKVSHCFRARRVMMKLNGKKNSNLPLLLSSPPPAIAVAVASAPSPGDDTVFDRSFAVVMNDMRPLPHYSYLQQHQPQQAASYQQQETLVEGHPQQQLPPQMLAYFLGGAGGNGPHAHWTSIKDPTPTSNTYQEGQQSEDGRQRTISQDQQEVWKSAEEGTLHFYQGPSSQGSGGKYDSKGDC